MKTLVGMLVVVAAVMMTGLICPAGEDVGAPAQLPVGRIQPADPAVVLNAASLSLALDSPSKLVRYHAAATLADVGSRVSFLNGEKVIPLLGQALQERGAYVAFVASPETEAANLFQVALRKKGYLVDTATNEATAVNVAFAGAIKDILFVDASMKPTLKRLLHDYRTSTQPLVLIADEGEARDARLALGERVAGYVIKPFDADTIDDAVAEVIRNVPVPPGKSLADSFNLLAAEALAGIDLRTTVYPVADAVPALIDALTLRDEVKLPVMVCLGNLGAAEAVPSLMLLAGSDAQSEAARIGAINAIDNISRKAGEINPDAKALMERLMLDPSRSIRNAAAIALGGNGVSDAAVERLIEDPRDVPGLRFGE